MRISSRSSPNFRAYLAHVPRLSVKQGRGTHTYGIHARGVARIVAPVGFPQNDFLTAGKTYPVIIRHSAPGGAKDNRAQDAASASVKFFDGAVADPAAEGIHDIVMNTGRTLFVATARTFFALVITPNPDRGEKLVKTGMLNDRILSEAYRSGASFTDFFLSFSDMLQPHGHGFGNHVVYHGGGTVW